MKNQGLLVALLLFSGFMTSRVAADVVTVGTSKDNTLYEDPTGSLSNGSGFYVFSGRTAQASNFLRRGLLKFDLAGSVPAGSTINSVTLILNVSRTRFGSPDIGLHRVLADWGEGASDADGQEGPGATSTP